MFFKSSRECSILRQRTNEQDLQTRKLANLIHRTRLELNLKLKLKFKTWLEFATRKRKPNFDFITPTLAAQSSPRRKSLKPRIRAFMW